MTAPELSLVSATAWKLFWVFTKARPLLSVVLADVKVTAPPNSLDIPAYAPASAIDVDHSAEGKVL